MGLILTLSFSQAQGPLKWCGFLPKNVSKVKACVTWRYYRHSYHLYTKVGGQSLQDICVVMRERAQNPEGISKQESGANQALTLWRRKSPSLALLPFPLWLWDCKKVWKLLLNFWAYTSVPFLVIQPSCKELYKMLVIGTLSYQSKAHIREFINYSS